MSKLFGLFNDKTVNNDPTEKPPVIAITAEKGGVGKTTTAVNLAANLVELKGLKVLLVDMDPQGHVSEALKQFITEKPMRSLSETLLARKPQFIDSIIQTDIKGLYAATADRSLRQAESVLAGRIGKEFVLGKALDSVLSSFDCVILDSPPNLGNLTLNVVVSASHLIIPVDMSPLAAMALGNMMQTLDTIAYSLGRAPKTLGILRTKVDRRRIKVNREVGQKLKQDFGDLLFDTMIPENTSVTRSQIAGRPLMDFDSRSPAAKAYEAFTTEAFDRLKA